MSQRRYISSIVANDWLSPQQRPMCIDAPTPRRQSFDAPNQPHYD
jgi:hypothetical protein